jgi:hypothetical protein
MGDEGMRPVAGFEIGKQVCEALGLDFAMPVKTIDIHIGSMEAVTVTLATLPEKDQMEKVLHILSHYDMVHRDSHQVPREVPHEPH